MKIQDEAEARKMDWSKPFKMLAAVKAEAEKTGAKSGILTCCKCEATFHWNRAPNGHAQGQCSSGQLCIGFLE